MYSLPNRSEERDILYNNLNIYVVVVQKHLKPRGFQKIHYALEILWSNKKNKYRTNLST